MQLPLPSKLILKKIDFDGSNRKVLLNTKEIIDMEVNAEELESTLEIIIGVIVGFPVSVAILGSEISVNVNGALYNFYLKKEVIMFNCDTCGAEAVAECRNIDGAHDGDREIFACESCSWENHASCLIDSITPDPRAKSGTVPRMSIRADESETTKTV